MVSGARANRWQGMKGRPGNFSRPVVTPMSSMAMEIVFFVCCTAIELATSRVAANAGVVWRSGPHGSDRSGS